MGPSRDDSSTEAAVARSSRLSAIAEAYTGGSSKRWLGAQYGVHEATICLLLQRLNLRCRGGRVVTDELIAEA